MPSSGEISFDRLGLHFVEPTFWHGQDQAKGLAQLLGHFLYPDDGHAWFRMGDGPWVQANDETLPAIGGTINELVDIWTDALRGSYGELAENGRCAIFLDAARFHTCVQDRSGLPDAFYVGFEVDWSRLGDGTLFFSPHLRVTNVRPSSGKWAPEDPAPQTPRSFTPDEAATYLEEGLWKKVVTAFEQEKHRRGLGMAALDLGDGQQHQPLFYYASPTTRLEDADSYLTGAYLRALNRLAGEVLASPDIRSAEIKAGVLEGCLAVFTHSPSVHQEFSLVIPMKGASEAAIEQKLHFVTDQWHFLDLRATRSIQKIAWELEADQLLAGVWEGSLDVSMRLSEVLFSLLAKTSIQPRMFALTGLLNGFLAKLQARTFASAMKRRKFQADMNRLMGASRLDAQKKFTVQKIAGLGLLENVSDGYTRVHRAFEQKISEAADSAKELAEGIASVSESLRHTAGLEENVRESEKKKGRAREEQSANLLNRVLALVAVLAAIPLIFGEFDTSSLATVIGPLPIDFAGIGLNITFWAALVAMALTVFAIVNTWWSGHPTAVEPRGVVAEAKGHSRTLFDFYRGYGLARRRQMIFEELDEDTSWDDVTEQIRKARGEVSEFDLGAARAVAASLQKSQTWDVDAALPTSDEAWAEYMEQRVCRFVLLSDILDLRPENLHLPVTLCVHRFKYGAGGLNQSPVSDREFNRVMSNFGYSDPEIEEIEAWARRDDIEAATAVDFVDACEEAGITALHVKVISGYRVAEVLGRLPAEVLSDSGKAPETLEALAEHLGLEGGALFAQLAALAEGGDETAQKLVAAAASATEQ